MHAQCTYLFIGEKSTRTKSSFVQNVLGSGKIFSLIFFFKFGLYHTISQSKVNQGELMFNRPSVARDVVQTDL